MIVRFFGCAEGEGGTRAAPRVTLGQASKTEETGGRRRPGRVLLPKETGAASSVRRSNVGSGSGADGSEATMRAHDRRDQPVRLASEGFSAEEPEPALALKAALSGRLVPRDPVALMGLQRAVGNALQLRLSSTRSARRSTTWSPRWHASAWGPSYGHGGPVRHGLRHAFASTTTALVRDSAKSVNAPGLHRRVQHCVPTRQVRDLASGQAHDRGELTHVVQQRNGPVDGSDAGGGVKISDPSDRFE